jgi:CBS domain-containing protein
MCDSYPGGIEKTQKGSSKSGFSAVSPRLPGVAAGREDESDPRGETVGEKIREVMTKDPATCRTDETARDAAQAMRDGDFGAVVVVAPGEEGVRGILTDRDIVVRAVAEGKAPSQTKISEIFTTEPTTLFPDDSIDEAVRALRNAHVRRLPVVEEGRVVGIVSIGDLAEARDERSALAAISAAAPNN